MPEARDDCAAEQSIVDSWREWIPKEMENRRRNADRAYKRALQVGDEPSWQHAEIVERSYGQLQEMTANQDPYFARVRGRMKDVDGELFEVDLRVHRYHRSEVFPLLQGGEMLDISHLAPLADLVRNPAQKELALTLSDRQFLDLSQGETPQSSIIVMDCGVEDIELEDGQVLRVAPRYGAIFEDRVKRRLGQSATPALDILADVLDAEQNAIVGNRDPKMRLVILDGPAGTGKTVVAAHRIAVAVPPDSPGFYLTPTTTLRDYVRPVLPRLGLERSRANVWGLADLATIIWPDLAWQEHLEGMVPESPYGAREWREALDASRRDLGQVAPDRLYRQAAKRLGQNVGATFGLGDVAPLLWLAAWLKRPPIKADWVIVDEAQAIPLLAYEALSQWLGRRVSWILAGDLMQQGSHHDWDGWTLIQTALGVPQKGLAHLWLSRSYRVPPKIHAAAERLRLALNPHGKASESVPWHVYMGEVVVSEATTESELISVVERRVEELLSVGIVSVALLAPNDARLAYWQEIMSFRQKDMQVLRGQGTYLGGVILTALDTVRGLEFDGVIILDATASYYPHTDSAARILYTSITRARRRVDLITMGEPSPWLPLVAPDHAWQH